LPGPGAPIRYLRHAPEHAGENIETYIKRLEKLEEIANSFAGVDKSYAIQAGREVA
jgi:HD superfamily phosphodiesterase